MNIINKSTEYAVFALLHLEKARGLTSSQDLSRILSLPQPFLRRILNSLRSAKLVKSVRGQHGGFELVKKLELISLWDLILLFQGNIALSDCGRNSILCSHFKRCKLKTEVMAVETVAEERFKKISIRDLEEPETIEGEI